jgi:glucokinase
VLRDHIARAGIARVIEVWCKVSPETAAARYRARSAERHPGHLPATYADELFDLAERARPIAIGPVVVIDAERAGDPRVFEEVHGLLTARTSEAWSSR